MASSASPPSTASSKSALSPVPSVSPIVTTISISVTVPIPVTVSVTPISERHGTFVVVVVEMMPAHSHATDVFFLLLDLDLGLLEVLVLFPLGMYALFALPPVGTETC